MIKPKMSVVTEDRVWTVALQSNSNSMLCYGTAGHHHSKPPLVLYDVERFVFILNEGHIKNVCHLSSCKADISTVQALSCVFFRLPQLVLLLLYVPDCLLTDNKWLVLKVTTVGVVLVSLMFFGKILTH